MKFYGLHWVANDGTPMQLRIETRTLEIWGRSCPRGGEWTAWRRLDVYRNADGTLNETVNNASHADKADTAVRLESPITINLAGVITGTGKFDGANNVIINTEYGSGGDSDTASRLKAMEKRIEELEASSGSCTCGDLAQKVSAMQADITFLKGFHGYGDADNNKN